ncbi:MAG TPA: MmgE/PrpD family protein [Desulfatiglandales bacterium]|nr:MmgE/PrpD family protein [Desulfatiglandales bacterium]
MNETEKLAQFVCFSSFDAFPQNVVTSAKKRILDAVGVGVFAAKSPWGRIVTDFAVENGCSGSSTLLGGLGRKCESLFAAFANGTCVHGFELDDVHYPSISHPGSVVIPAAIALGEARGISGKTLLESVILGYEVMGRIGATISRHHIAKGFHPTGTFGVFGAAATCAKILSLNEEEIQDAFGIAGSFSSGIMQFSATGSMVKRVHAGNAAEQGMKAALLAKKGFTGPREVLEGKYGFCRVFVDFPESIEWEKMTAALGEKYVVQEISVKPSAACGVLHSVIDSIRMINEERKIEADQIEEIKVLGHENLVNEHNVYEPNSILSAQYSLPFTVGLAVEGKIDDPYVYLNESVLTDEKVLEIGSKVTTELDEGIQRVYPDKFGAEVSIRFKDGKIVKRKVFDPKGSCNNPFTERELEEKFRAVTKGSLLERSVSVLIDRINSIESSKNINELFEGISW